MRLTLIHIGRLLVVGALVFSALWITSQFLGKTIPVYAYDSDLELWVIKPDSAVMQRLEGSATSYYGYHGLNRVLWTQKECFSTNIFLWGDSFVEALNVADEAKPDVVLTKQLQWLSGNTNIVAWGIGESGLSCAGQIVKLQKYEKVLGKPLVHILLTTSVKNDFGPSVSDSRAKLESDPEWRVVPQSEASFQHGGRARELLSCFRFNFVRDIINAFKSLRIEGLVFFELPKHTPDPVLACSAQTDRNTRLDQSMDFLLGRLRKQTDVPILIAYCPRVPQVRKGVVDFVDYGQTEAVALRDIAARYGIEFLDLTPVLVDAYESHEVLCMGFQNGQLGYGHLNERGIEIVFTAVAKYLKEKYAVHTN